jgi:hypothetical protein
VSGSGQQGAVAIGQDDWFDPMPARLGGQFAVMEKNEKWTYPLRRKSAHHSEHMTLDPAEDLTDRADRDTLWISEGWRFLKKVKTILAMWRFAVSNGIIGGVRAWCPYAALHGFPSLCSLHQGRNNVRAAFLPTSFPLLYFMGVFFSLS